MEKLSTEQSEELADAINFLNKGTVHRLDSDWFKAYTVGGDLIRVDIKIDKEQ